MSDDRDGPGWQVTYINVETATGDWHVHNEDDGIWRVVNGHTGRDAGRVEHHLAPDSDLWAAYTMDGKMIESSEDLVYAVLVVANHKPEVAS